MGLPKEVILPPPDSEREGNWVQRVGIVSSDQEVIADVLENGCVSVRPPASLKRQKCLCSMWGRGRGDPKE